MTHSTTSPAPYPIRFWLLTCMAMVVLMVFIGGVTRLSESGLSIVEWKLVTGIFPPLSQESWEAELAEYRNSPEYQQVNMGMSVDEFKQIYWLEWLHRLLGRMTGLIFIIPLIYFAVRKQLKPPLRNRMAIACVLVASQGVLGWLMVYSGLQDDPRVSPLRLAAHLSLAFIVFSWLYWTWLSINQIYRHYRAGGNPHQGEYQAIRKIPAFEGMTSSLAIRIVTALVFIQIIFGAFVAGLDAGLIYNSWPLMDGDFVPSHLLSLQPWYRNLYEYVPMVQWQHRTFACVVSVAIIAFILTHLKYRALRGLLVALFVVLLLQFKLGVLTLIQMVPIHLASAHQMVALLLLAVCVRLCYALPPKSQENPDVALQSAKSHGIVSS